MRASFYKCNMHFVIELREVHCPEESFFSSSLVFGSVQSMSGNTFRELRPTDRPTESVHPIRTERRRRKKDSITDLTHPRHIWRHLIGSRP
jgi:hypothetical protein